MRIIHTSDWHIGRTFHGHSTDEHLEQVLHALAQLVREHSVDVVIVAGDVFDHPAPKGDAFTMFNRVVRAVRDAGAVVVLSSGNHDGPARLAHLAEFAELGGVHVRADLARIAEPVLVPDRAPGGRSLAIYPVPYLHPALLAAQYPAFTGSTHAEALAFAADLVRADHARRGGAWVLAAHCFVVNVGADRGEPNGGDEPRETREESGLAEERDITRGGLDLVPLSALEGPDYIALGHIHGRSRLTETARYSGAPLRFSFGERDKPRGVWLVDLDTGDQSDDSERDDDGGRVRQVTWLDLPVPRDAVRLHGTFADLLADGAHEAAREAWVDVVLTDDLMPLDAMRQLQARYPHAVTLSHEPARAVVREGRSYAERVRGRSETEILAEFLSHVRNGHGPDETERALLAEALAALDAQESAR